VFEEQSSGGKLIKSGSLCLLVSVTVKEVQSRKKEMNRMP
jgi:hypothetical protein